MRRTYALLLLGMVACGASDELGPEPQRSRRIAYISRVEGTPPIETIFTPYYENDLLIAVHRGDPFNDRDSLSLRYDGAGRLIQLSDGKNTTRYGWRDGHPTQLIMNGARFDYGYEDELLATASYNGEELGRYLYANRKLVMLDVKAGTDVEFSYDEREQLTSVTGRPTTEYAHIGGQVSTVQMSAERWAITHEDGLIKTISRSGVRTPVAVTFFYDEGEVIGIHPVPPIPQAAMFGLDGKALPTVDLLSVDLTGNAFSAFGAY
ncbi:MAG TPA: hypothetical protein VLC93_09630 [Myxococcota bacterium]|nr:hypothetical protein [Myxococcota bacterium]